MSSKIWMEHNSSFFKNLNSRSLAILPVAAIEQHGDHLPSGTDAYIAEAMIDQVLQCLESEQDILVLPGLSFGVSLEHQHINSTITLSSDTFRNILLDIGASLARHGIKRFLILNSHGGNVSAINASILELRIKYKMFCITTNWMRFGLPTGILSEEEQAIDIHGGMIETALMMAIRPDLVQESHLRNFSSLQEKLVEKYKHLRAYGLVSFGWLADDLNEAGVAGNARRASAEIGKLILHHQSRACAELVKEIQDFDLDLLSNKEN